MTRYRIVPSKSRVWIDARSNVHPIHTEAGGLEGWLELSSSNGKVNGNRTPRGHLEFPIDNLKSGNPLEDREMRRRTDARRHPTISGDLKTMKQTGDTARYVVSGDLTFRGVARTYEDEMTVEIDGGTVNLAGQSTFDIRDFGMEPPRILMLRVQPEVTVRVEIVAEKDS
ncbi:MAG: YceI family protein [Ilumatobacteraceae bacterium]